MIHGVQGKSMSLFTEGVPDSILGVSLGPRILCLGKLGTCINFLLHTRLVLDSQYVN